MINAKDMEILSYLRRNAREKITMISRKTDIPATTIYDRIRIHHKRFVKKHTALLDFYKIGFDTKMHIAIKVPPDMIDKMQSFLMNHANVNSLYRTNSMYNFLAECVFRNTGCKQGFVDELQKYCAEYTIMNELAELKKEQFLTKPEHLMMV